MKALRTKAGLLALFLILSAPAHAQVNQCSIPDKIPAVQTENPPPGEVRNLRATQHLLALSWSPHFCKTHEGDAKAAFQCDGQAGKFGFILHGLWPDVAGRDDPAWCAPAKPLPSALIRRHLCMTPSPQLLQHEWAKHGTCATDDPEKYFRAASLLYDALKFPDMNRLSRRRITIASFTAAFSGLNPGIRPDMISVQTDKGGWLKEIRLCLDANLKPRICAPEDRGERQSRFLRIWRGE